MHICRPAGGVHNAIDRGSAIGATTIQLFTNNQKSWHSKPIPDSEVVLWKESRERTGMQKIMSHDSYLINLGAVKPDILEKSRKAFFEELERCHLLEIDYLNFHPGAATSGTEEQCLDTIVKSLKEVKPLSDKGGTRLLLETTAGQGTTVGWNFAHLDYIISRTKDDVPIGVCIDTCHIFSAGYDIRTEKGWSDTLDAFEKTVGLQHLYGIHVNDSMKPFGERKDRHANLGEGEIGIEAFSCMMKEPRLRHIPKYLETPEWRH